MPLLVSLFRERVNRMVAAHEDGNTELVEKMKAKLKTQIDELPANSVIVKEASAHLRKTQQVNFWEGLI